MSGLSRRNFLKVAGMGALVAGCSPIIDNGLQTTNPLTEEMATIQASNRTVHFLNRASFGATPELVTAVNETGIEAWFEQQMDYKSLDDLQTNLRLRRFDTLNMTPGDLLSFVRVPDRTDVANQLAAAMLVRAIYSNRQLFEVMVHFWSDHFSIYYFKEATSNLQTVDDRDVIRANAVGNFGEMLTASAHSPAMLVYLDNVVNEKSHPNENYAREIMELHTLGVTGAYTEDDVLEVARCFTGWSVSDRGTFEYRSSWHDDGEKTVLGHVIPAGGGKSDGDRVLEILINHLDTAHYVSSKLCRRFIEDEPSETVISDISRVWTQSQGDIPTIMRAIFTHDAFWNAPPKFKRPLEYVISTLRVLRANYNGSEQLVDRLSTMGHRPFGYATPDGYPDTATEWVGSFVPRWNFAQDATHGGQNGISIPIQQWTEFANQYGRDALARAVLQRDINDIERDAINSVVENKMRYGLHDIRQILAILISSPSFQWR